MQNKKQTGRLYYKFRAAALVLSVAGLVGGAAIAHADQYDEKINALSSQNAASRGVLNGLESQAGSYQAQISQLQNQIDTVQSQIYSGKAQQANLEVQIAAEKQEIATKKANLAADVKAMYIDGQMSTIEQLATSKNLSDYIDKEEYRTAVQNQLDQKIKDIAALQLQQQQKKQQVEQLLASQQAQNAQLASAQSQQNQLLSYNQGQQAAYNSQISGNNSAIQSLRQQQIAANARFIGTGAAGTGPTCGGGYPSKWCNAPQDSLIDNWGMYNRECVSYTAFRVAASGRYMPYWGGRGNANQWDEDARAAGIPVDTSPRAGDVAISNAGAYGHAMYVESVNGNGTINISQYNASLDGRYSTRSGLSPAGLVFIHF